MKKKHIFYVFASLVYAYFKREQEQVGEFLIKIQLKLVANTIDDDDDDDDDENAK